MSPPSPSRAKRRRTTMTAGHTGDAAAGAPFGDQYVDATPIISTEPVKRKRLDANVGHQQHMPAVVAPPQPLTTQYQLQTQQQQQPAASAAVTPRLAQQNHHQQQQQVMGMMTVYHRPTYRSDLAKRGYLVRNSLGCGSYSKVKKALNSRRNFELTAVKIVDRVRAPRDYQEKFMPRELALWPRLRHPNLIRFLDYFEDNQRVYMVLEFAEGGDALHHVQSTGALGEDRARTWAMQVTSAVTYMHDLGIAHRDLKLENLLLTGDLRTIKICDFGFVRQKTLADGGDMSQTFCGSKAYAAPEILQGRTYDPMKADVWALGVIMYIFITGKMPFDETKGTKSIVEEQKSLDMKWLVVRRPTPACQQLICRTFTWDFVERPTARAVLLDRWMLDHFAADQCPQPAAQPSPSHPGAGPFPDPAAVPALPGLHLHTAGDWAVAATGK